MRTSKKIRTLCGDFLSVIVAICSMSALADYTITSDTVYGDGSEVTWGMSPFIGNFIFDFSGGGDTLSFANRILLDGNNVSFSVPAGKIAVLAGGLTNNVEYSSSGETSSAGALLRNSGTGKGILVVSNSFDRIRLGLLTGTNVFESKSADITNQLYYVNVRNAGAVFNGGSVRSLGQFYLESGDVTLNDVDFYKAASDTYTHKEINLNNGTLSANNTTISGGSGAKIYVGGGYSGSTGRGTLNMDGGSLVLRGGIYLGMYGGKGTINLKSGTISAYRPKDNGSFDNIRHFVGYAASAAGEFNILGGEYHILGTHYVRDDDKVFVAIGHNGTGVVNVSGTGRFSIDRYSSTSTCRARVLLGVNSGSSGTLNLNEGGTFSTYSSYGIIGGNGTSKLLFNGGTFEAAGTIDTPSGMVNLVETNVATVAVGPKGGVVDTKGNDFHFMDPIVDSAVSISPEGFFAKRGSGMLTFHGANTYCAPTRIEAGGIALADDGALSPNSVLWVDSGVTVDLDGVAAQTVGGLAGKGTVANVSLTTAGNICPGGTNEVGTLTLSASSLTLASGARLIIDVDAQGNCDKLVVTGASSPLDLSNLVIEVVGTDADKIGPIISCDAGVTGKPQIVGTRCKMLSVSHSGDVVLIRSGFMLICF